MTAKINDINDFINMMRKVSPNIDPDKLDPDIILLCFNIYTEGYNAAMDFVDDRINQLNNRRKGGDK